MSKIICGMPVRNEAWCLGATARAVLQWCDGLIILNHCSRDRSMHIIGDVVFEYPGRVSWMMQDGEVWEEMAHRQRLLEACRSKCATHIVIVDADEILTANLLPLIRNMVLSAPVGTTMQVPWIQLRGSLQTFHAVGMWSQQNASMAFADEPRCHWAARAGYHFHHRHPMGRECVPYQPLGPAFLNRRCGGLMHLQMVSDRRLRAKQALYVMQETVRWPGRMTAAQLNAMYGPTVYGEAFTAETLEEYQEKQPELAGVPAEWWAGYEPLMQYIDVDAEPWQEAECKKLMDQHGEKAFEGLDLFGVL